MYDQRISSHRILCKLGNPKATHLVNRAFAFLPYAEWWSPNWGIYNFRNIQSSKHIKDYTFMFQVAHFLKLICISRDLWPGGIPFLTCSSQWDVSPDYQKNVILFSESILLLCPIVYSVIIPVNNKFTNNWMNHIPSNKALFSLGYSQIIILTKLKENLI